MALIREDDTPDPAPSAAPATSPEAQELVAELRGTLQLALAQLGQAYRSEAWRALGYESWIDCLAVELGHNLVRLAGFYVVLSGPWNWRPRLRIVEHDRPGAA